jgi:hypothetical protein
MQTWALIAIERYSASAFNPFLKSINAFVLHIKSTNTSVSIEFFLTDIETRIFLYTWMTRTGEAQVF